MTKTREASDLINNIYSDFTSNNVGIGTTNATSKLTVAGGISVSGVVTASAFVDDGTNLLTAINTKTSTGKAIAMAMIFG